VMDRCISASGVVVSYEVGAGEETFPKPRIDLNMLDILCLTETNIPFIPSVFHPITHLSEMLHFLCVTFLPQILASSYLSLSFVTPRVCNKVFKHLCTPSRKWEERA